MEFTNLFLSDMEKLKTQEKFYNYETRCKVYDAVYESIENDALTDDIATMFEHLDDCTDDDEYYNCIHCLAQWLKLEN